MRRSDPRQPDPRWEHAVPRQAAVNSTPPTSQAGTVDKAVDVLFHLLSVPHAEGVSAIGRALGIPKSSAHRLLASLARRQLVERDVRGGYRLGAGLIALGLGSLDREPLVAAARSVLEAEAEAVGETFFLVAARVGAITVLDKAEGSGFLRAAPPVGSTVPLHATAVGKLYMAHCAEQFPLPAELQRFTLQTRIRAQALAPEVAEARERGWALSRDEWIEGLSVLAAPVFSHGHMCAAVAVAAASPRLEALGQDVLAPRVMAAGQRIADRLAGRSETQETKEVG
jgi:IclR family acetate operon transcriptional repressor